MKFSVDIKESPAVV